MRQLSATGLREEEEEEEEEEEPGVFIFITVCTITRYNNGLDRKEQTRNLRMIVWDSLHKKHAVLPTKKDLVPSRAPETLLTPQEGKRRSKCLK